MTTVEYVWARRQVMVCIAALADEDYQARVWVRHEMPHPGYYDELGLQIHVLFDDFQVLPEPGTGDDGILVSGDEIARLRELGAVFDPMIDRLSESATSDADYLADEQWPTVVELAQQCLPAFILGGGWNNADTDGDAWTKNRAEGRIPTVGLPATRRRVMTAVAGLADEEYQRRTWTGDTDDAAAGSLEACLHTLFHDAHVLPDPSRAIGRVLLAGDEIERLTALGDALQPFRDQTAPEPWRDPPWRTIVKAALSCLPALVIAGAWIGPEPVTASSSAPGSDAPRHG